MNRTLSKLRDDYISDKKFLKELQTHPAFGLNWWDGITEDKEYNPFHKFITMVWPEHRWVGFEYWVNEYPIGNHLEWHNDKDEGEFKESGRVLSPDEGIVFWTHADELKGGNLEIRNGDNTLTVAPKANRLIMFDTSLPHRVTEVKAGKRRALLVNPWRYKPKTFLKQHRVVYL